MKAARSILKFQGSSVIQFRLVLRIIGIPKSGKSTIGNTILPAILSYLSHRPGEAENNIWMAAPNVRVLCADMLDCKPISNIEEKMRYLCTSIGTTSVTEPLSGHTEYDLLKKNLLDYTSSLAPGSVIFIDELQAFFEGLDKKTTLIVSLFLRNWMIKYSPNVQFVVSGSSTPALLSSLGIAEPNGISFFLGNSDISTNVAALEEFKLISTFRELIKDKFAFDIERVDKFISEESSILRVYRRYLRVSDLNMLRRNEFSSPSKLFTRVEEIYLRDMIPLLRCNEVLQNQLSSFAHADGPFFG